VLMLRLGGPAAGTAAVTVATSAQFLREHAYVPITARDVLRLSAQPCPAGFLYQHAGQQCAACPDGTWSGANHTECTSASLASALPCTAANRARGGAVGAPFSTLRIPNNAANRAPKLTG